MSLYPLSRDLQELLAAKNFPLRVHYGPERMHREGYPENVIVVERDREADDTLGPARGAQQNPRKLRSRGLQGIATIYVRSSRASARIGDHEELCEKFVDAVLAALVNWATSTRAEGFMITSSRYVSEAERLAEATRHAPGVKAEAIEQWPGVVYRLKFTVPRALLDKNYAGESLPTGALGGIGSRTDAYGQLGGGDGETGCDSLPVVPPPEDP